MTYDIYRLPLESASIEVSISRTRASKQRMVKNKGGCLAKLPREQKCKFLLGPISSWFMPGALDVWSTTWGNKKTNRTKVSQDDLMDCDQSSGQDNPTSSYLIYGSIGCFCYGRIHHRQSNNPEHSRSQQQEAGAGSAVAIDRLIDVKEDNSRISCVRFLRCSPYPLAMVLTESGSLVVHDCELSENVIHYKKSELITKLIEPSLIQPEESNGEHCSKKPKFNVTQQINSCVWPNSRNAFIGISLLREKKNLVCWLHLKDLTDARRKGVYTVNKTDFIESSELLDLDLVQVSSPICCMESCMLDNDSCLVATAQDDGLIVVAKVNLTENKLKRSIKLARHNDQICSLSLFTGNPRKFPSGVLASSSRNGLVLVWDIENEFYFADYQASVGGNRNSTRINWYALSFIHSEDCKSLSLAVCNTDSGITVLDIPENIRSKIRLKEVKDKVFKKQACGEQTIKHHALIFNLVFDPMKQSLVTSSLDGNHIIWKCRNQSEKSAKKDGPMFEVEPVFLYPSMSNNSRTHMMRYSPIREDLLGVALGKAGIRFYRILKDFSSSRFDMNPSCGAIHRKITKASLSPTSLAWHPTHEYRVAIGTLEGKVFRIELTPRKATLVEAEHKPPNQLDRQKIRPTESLADDILDIEYQPLQRSDVDCDDDDKSTINGQTKTDGVYSLCWGPNPSCPQDLTRLAIYAVGSISHRLSIYYNKKDAVDKLTNFLDEFLDQSLPEAIGEASEVGWKSSMEFIALGTTTGKVIIAKYLDESHEGRSKDYLFTRLAVIQGPFGNSNIQCLSWHPSADKDETQYFSLAVSANDSMAYIFNLKENILVADVKSRLKIGDRSYDYGDNSSTNLVTTYTHKLDLHVKAISDIQWNPHDPNELATSSFDRTCYVWRLGIDSSGLSEPAVAVSKFSARDRLFTLEWSLVENDLIYTSGHDSTIWAWRPSENQVREECQAQANLS